MSHLRRALIFLATAASFASLTAVAGAASTPTWLCFPGATPNPCVTSLSAEQFSNTGTSLGVVKPKASTHNKFDCFYVYPTVSNEPTPVADLKIGPEQDSIALYQASQYSQDCTVYAPVYRQVTITALNTTPSPVTAQDQANANSDVVNAWKYYLKHYNKGRGFVLMGHSQGSFVLRKLIAANVDNNPKVRKQLISAVLLGGNVVVKKGGNGEGGDFKNIPICRSNKQLGCVIGWSTFDQPVPADAKFGRIGGAGVTATAPKPGTEILCTNPASLGGGSGLVDGLFPVKPFATGLLSLGISLLGDTLPTTSQPWVETVGGYKAQCSNADSANVLQVTAQGTSPVLHPSPDPTWGLHLVDAGIAWGTMVKLVATEGKTYLAAQAKHHKHS